jgi:hypothetical protein
MVKIFSNIFFQNSLQSCSYKSLKKLIKTLKFSLKRSPQKTPKESSPFPHLIFLRKNLTQSIPLPPSSISLSSPTNPQIIIIPNAHAPNHREKKNRGNSKKSNPKKFSFLSSVVE